MENKNKTSKPKKTGNNINGKRKGTSKRRTKMDSFICIFLHLFCFFDLFCFCFYFALFLLFTWEKNKRKKIEKNKKNKTHANGQVHFLTIFFPFLSFLFLPFIFFLILLICFVFFPFFFRVVIFQVFRKIRINYGLADITLAFRSRPLGRGYI